MTTEPLVAATLDVGLMPRAHSVLSTLCRLLDSDKNRNNFSDRPHDRRRFLHWLPCTVIAFSLDATTSCDPRHGSCRKRSRCPKSVDRVALRQTNAAHSSPADRGQPNRSDPCSDFRSPVVACGRPLPGSGSTPRRGYLFLYTPIKRLNPMCTLAAAISRCRAGADRLRRRGRKAHHAGLLSLRDTLPVAIPAFPGNCLDVS